LAQLLIVRFYAAKILHPFTLQNHAQPQAQHEISTLLLPEESVTEGLRRLAAAGGGGAAAGKGKGKE
jgi:hypothetical protein